jgi:hypothetical protein
MRGTIVKDALPSCPANLELKVDRSEGLFHPRVILELVPLSSLDQLDDSTVESNGGQLASDRI